MSNSKMFDADDRIDRALRTLTGDELAGARARLMTGSDLMNVQAGAWDNMAVLGCLYPEGTFEYECEKIADAMLEAIAKSEKAIADADEKGEFSVDYVEAVSPAEIVANTTELVRACERASSAEELADVVDRFSGSYPEVKSLAEKIAYTRGWLSEAAVNAYRTGMAV